MEVTENRTCVCLQDGGERQRVKVTTGFGLSIGGPGAGKFR